MAPFSITFEVPVNGRTGANIRAYGRDHGMTPEHVCSLILEGKFGGAAPVSVESLGGEPGLEMDLGFPFPGERFSVAENFPNYPRVSIDLAQTFVDRATALPNVSAFKQRRGIALKPRIAGIEYILSHRADAPGIVATVAGTPGKFEDPRRLLVPDRKSYSRARILTDDDLHYFMLFVEQVYVHRYGPF